MTEAEVLSELKEMALMYWTPNLVATGSNAFHPRSEGEGFTPQPSPLRYSILKSREQMYSGNLIYASNGFLAPVPEASTETNIKTAADYYIYQQE